MSESKSGISKIATAAVVIAAISLSLPALGVLGIHIGLLPPLVGFSFFTAGAVLGGLLSLLLGVVAVIATRGGSDPDGRTRAFTALGGGVALLGVVAIAGAPGADVPPINDITTNLTDPPSFQADPAGRGRDMGYPAEFIPQVKEAYADLQPIAMSDAPAAAFDRALAAAEALDWEITLRDRAAGTFEARDTTAIFKFVDDIAVRIRPAPGGSVLDIRSKSRDGRGDVGANAARIRAFTAEL